MKKFYKQLLVFVMLGICLLPGSSAIHAEEAEKETFTVGMECNYAPFNWTQVGASDTAVSLGDTGYCDGYDVVIAQRIADALGKDLVIQKMSWDGLEPSLQGGIIDAVIAGMTDTAERRQRVDFTQPYYESEMVMIVRKDSPEANARKITDFSGKKVLGQLNTLYDKVIDQIKDVIHMTAMEDYPTMVMQMNKGMVDGITAELPVAAGIIATNPDLTYIEFEPGKGFNIDLTDTSVSIAIAQGNTELKDQINTVLADMDDKERKQIMDDAISRIPATMNLSDNWLVAASQIVQEYWPLFLSGIKSTLLLAFIGTILGLIIGLFVGGIRAVKVEARDSFFIKCVKRITWLITTIYIEVFRGTPMMVQAAFIFYGLKGVLDWTPFVAGIFVITINTGAYMAEIVRAGIQSVDKGQVEGARSIGMSGVQTMLYIVIPQAIRNSFPSIGNEFVVNIKDSSVLNVIALTELFYQAKSVAGSLYAFVPSYFVVACIYLCLTFPTTRLLTYIENRMNRKATVDIKQNEKGV